MFADHSHHCEKGAAPERGYPMLSGAALCTTAKAVLSAGRFVASKSYLARRWGISPTSAYDFMRTLEKRGYLTRSVVDGICVYTLIDPSEISDINTDRSIDHPTDRSSDHLNNYAAECCASYPTKTPTTSPTGFPTQYKEVRNKKEEKENIYRERVRAERESLNNFIVSFFASQNDDLIRFASGLGQTVEGLRALAEEIATEWRLGGVTHY